MHEDEITRLRESDAFHARQHKLEFVRRDGQRVLFREHGLERWCDYGDMLSLTQNPVLNWYTRGAYRHVLRMADASKAV